MNRVTKVLVMSAMFLVLGIAIGYTLANKKKSPSLEANKEAGIGQALSGEIAVFDQNGVKRTLSEYRGKAVMINFWASWCGPCLTEMPSIYQLYEMYKARGFEVLAISLDDNLDSGVSALFQKVGKAPFPIFEGTKSELLQQFPLEGVPYTVLIDRNGVVRYSKAAALNWLTKENRERVEKIL